MILCVRRLAQRDIFRREFADFVAQSLDGATQFVHVIRHRFALVEAFLFFDAVHPSGARASFADLATHSFSVFDRRLTMRLSEPGA